MSPMVNFLVKKSFHTIYRLIAKLQITFNLTGGKERIEKRSSAKVMTQTYIPLI